MTPREPDGTTYPWAQDLDDGWHVRPLDDEWTEGEINARGRCGAQFGSVHVSSFRPTPDEYLGEYLCPKCEVLA